MGPKEKFLAIDGEVIASSAVNLAIDLHKEGKIEFITSFQDSSGRRERWLVFRHNDKIQRLRSNNARWYFLALVNERQR